MKESLKRWRANPTLAFVLPLFVFLALNSFINLWRIDNRLFPWYRMAPEHWGYPLQCLICGGLLCFFWKHYPWRPKRGFLLATIAGILGIAVWLAPTALFDAWNWSEDTAPRWARWFGFQEREDSGFDPSIFRESPLAYWGTIVLRFVRAVIVVPLVEEIFWRGFLMRYLYNLDGDFWEEKLGAWRWWTVGATALAFMLSHQPVDYFAALVYGLLGCFVIIKTKSLAACVWMHAVANFIMGVYALASGNRGLW